MLRAQIDNDRDSVGGSGITEVTFRPLPFAEHRTFAKRSHVKDRKGFDMTYFGSTRVVDQACSPTRTIPLRGSERIGALTPILPKLAQWARSLALKLRSISLRILKCFGDRSRPKARCE